MFRLLTFAALRRRRPSLSDRRLELQRKICQLHALSPAAAAAVENLVDDMIHDEEARSTHLATSLVGGAR